ncbi:hypothetical protein ACFFGV_13870 [Pontibacillus salicampi]|uniref:DUF2197 domain-containing protein n=1 Tax=Pontibacillus salicampi TaxID=1449801 RepID=A0ABV6LQG8_9BACI
MLETNCTFCKKEFTIGPSDSQYYRIRRKPDSRYVCKKCNQSMQQEAQNSTGLKPEDIDKYDAFFR